MCGIVGAVAKRQVTPLLLEGLNRLEYRGYDSAGIAVVANQGDLQVEKIQGKVADLYAALDKNPLAGHCGLAHTRWATHGKPNVVNAHPHVAGSGSIAVVHNGIIENHALLRDELTKQGYQFASETDTEVVAHLIHAYLDQGYDLLAAVCQLGKRLQGTFALGILSTQPQQQLIALTQGSPLVLGLGVDENYFASDTLALLPLTQRFILLQDGDIAQLSADAIQIQSASGEILSRPIIHIDAAQEAVNRGQYRHFMQKEIFEQSNALQNTLADRLGEHTVHEAMFGAKAETIFDRTQAVHIVACGTSYHAGLVARYWIESMAGIPCQVDIASEYRYRDPIVQDGTLFVAISQSGETADTLAALRKAKELDYTGVLSICNIPQSAIVRESELVILTRAGREIGVASTKAFTTQLVALLLLTVVLGRRHQLRSEEEAHIVALLRELPRRCADVLRLDAEIKQLAQVFADKQHTLFLGRGAHYPVALEGALKLKEISYIHAEAYPAGELKHGPLALVDDKIPVVAVAPNDSLLEKLQSNLAEVRARGGQLIVLCDESIIHDHEPSTRIVSVPKTPALLSPIIFTIPLQLLAYHVAVIKGTDVDQPRNLAKSVTVE